MSAPCFLVRALKPLPFIAVPPALSPRHHTNVAGNQLSRPRGVRLRFAHPGISRLRLRVRSKRGEPERSKLRPSAPETEIGPMFGGFWISLLLVFYTNKKGAPPCPARLISPPSPPAATNSAASWPPSAICAPARWCRTTAAAADPSASVPTSSTAATAPTGCSPGRSTARPAAARSRPSRSRPPRPRSLSASACDASSRT